ncbi:phosphoribosyltransferase [Amycolatopsis pigmentata]|uniref:Phosphoribosyltransferase n=1 Tax=Amycolatopsis pigmentata TaxID=450801 RepID=A0ABW5FQ00_9PSEU
MQFWDRRQAGQALAEKLLSLRGHHPVVVGVARGGVVVAAEIARVLGAPLDVLPVGKVEAEEWPGTTLAAVGEGGVLVTDYDAANRLGMSPAQLRSAAKRKRIELTRRIVASPRLFHRTAVSGRTVILVDDGITSGATVRAAIRVLRARGAARIVLAVPVAPVDALARISAGVDMTVCLRRQPWRQATRNLYSELSPLSDEAVADALENRSPEPVPA